MNRRGFLSSILGTAAALTLPKWSVHAALQFVTDGWSEITLMPGMLLLTTQQQVEEWNAELPEGSYRARLGDHVWRYQRLRVLPEDKDATYQQ